MIIFNLCGVLCSFVICLPIMLWGAYTTEIWIKQVKYTVLCGILCLVNIGLN